MSRLKSPVRLPKASIFASPKSSEAARPTKKKKRLLSPLSKLSEEVRTIQRSHRSILSQENEICAKVLAAFESATSAKSKPKATAKPAKKSKPAKKAPAKAVRKKSKPVAKPAKKVVAKAGKAASKPVTNTNGRRPVAGPKKPVKMTPFLKLQRERLHILRDSLLDAMAGVAKGTLRSRPEGSEASAFGQHQADAGSDAYDKDFALSLLSQEQDALYEIEEALMRIEAGTYGICEMSGEPIHHARLEALPFARLTVERQAEYERTKNFQRNRAPITSLFGLTDSEGEEEAEVKQPQTSPGFTLGSYELTGENSVSLNANASVSFHPDTNKYINMSAWIEENFSKNPIPDFEWSCAIIPLCKGFELEILNRVIAPLKEMSAEESLTTDIEDRDFGKVANFCAGKTKIPPELGVIAWFLRTAIHSKSRRNTSVLLRTFLSLVAAMAEPTWVLEPRSLLQTIEQLTSKYRNPSAHTTAMSEEHYQGCKELISKPKTGALWKLAAATYLKSKPKVEIPPI